MAADDCLVTSLKFMTDAAHLLVQTAPETSSHLMGQRNSLIFHNGLDQTDVQRQHVCGSCGYIMVIHKAGIEKTEKKVRNSSRGRHGRATPEATDSNKHKVITCGNCGRYTSFKIPTAPSLGRSRIKLRQIARRGSGRPQPEVGAQPATLSLDKPAPVSANASSKKRAKNRKQGLQALLQQTQSSSVKSGLGLSLADFMKK